MPTVEKIENDIAKTKEKIAEMQKKIRNLETQKIEEEKAQIVRLVKAVDLDSKELALLLKSYAKGNIVLPPEYSQELQGEQTNEA